MTNRSAAFLSLTAVLFSAFATCIGCVSKIEVRTDPVESYRVLIEAESRVYHLKVFCLGGTNSSGSAVDLGSGLVATAKHITEGREDCIYSLLATDGRSYDAVFLVDDEDADLAILKADTHLPAIKYVVPERYMVVWAVGYPRQLGSPDQVLTVSSGVVMGPVQDGEIRISAPIYFGSSGGAVFDDRGRLIGISVALYASMPLGSAAPIPYQATTYAVPSTRVRELLWSMRVRRLSIL